MHQSLEELPSTSGAAEGLAWVFWGDGAGLVDSCGGGGGGELHQSPEEPLLTTGAAEGLARVCGGGGSSQPDNGSR